jgi:hypothetical protein
LAVLPLFKNFPHFTETEDSLISPAVHARVLLIGVNENHIQNRNIAAILNSLLLF